MQRTVLFILIFFSTLNLFGQENYRTKRVTVKHGHGQGNVKEIYHVIRPTLFFTFRPHNRTRHGLYESFYLNGDILERKEYVLGEVIWYQQFNNFGQITEEYADSTGIKIKNEYRVRTLLSTSKFKNGEKHGFWSTYTSDFRRSSIKEYESGELIRGLTMEYSPYEEFDGLFLSVMTTTNIISGETTKSVNIKPFYKTMDFPIEVRQKHQPVVTVCIEITEYEDCSNTFTLIDPLGPETNEILNVFGAKITSVLTEFKRKNNINCKNYSYPYCINFRLN